MERTRRRRRDDVTLTAVAARFFVSAFFCGVAGWAGGPCVGRVGGNPKRRQDAGATIRRNGAGWWSGVTGAARRAAGDIHPNKEAGPGMVEPHRAPQQVGIVESFAALVRFGRRNDALRSGMTGTIIPRVPIPNYRKFLPIILHLIGRRDHAATAGRGFTAAGRAGPDRSVTARVAGQGGPARPVSARRADGAARRGTEQHKEREAASDVL